MTVINWTADIGATLDTLAADLGLTPLELSAYAGTTTVPVRLTRSVPKMVPNADTAPLVVMAEYAANKANPSDPACPWARLYHDTARAILALTGSDIRPKN
jgi:hypothetical protein